MHTLELSLAGLLVSILLTMSGYYGWRQWRMLRGLGPHQPLSDEDQAYYRAQGWRRIVGCALMLLVAGFLAAWYLLGAGELASARQAGHTPTAEEQRLINHGAACILGLFVALLALIAVALVDVLAIRRYGIRHFRRIQTDRRQMIAQQLSRLRSERNGNG